MRVSFQMLPDQPIAELLAAMEIADRLGFYACYSADETYHKDPWQLLATGAARTEAVRLGPCVAPVFLRDPTLIARAGATLDELSGGRAEIVIGIGNVALLEQCGIAWRGTRPIERLREAHHVIRTLLDEGRLDFAGDFYQASGLFTAARPVQARLPVMIGAMGGPRSMQLAGEVADGLHMAAAYSTEAVSYAVEHTLAGAARAGRDGAALDLGNSVLGAISTDREAARTAGRILAGFYVASMPEALLRRHDVEPAAVAPMVAAFVAGDVGQALAAAPDGVLDRLVLAGTPDDWIEQVHRDLAPGGLNHLLVSFADPFTVRSWAGLEVDGLPTLAEQLELVGRHVIPALASARQPAAPLP